MNKIPGHMKDICGNKSLPISKIWQKLSRSSLYRKKRELKAKNKNLASLEQTN
jgi:hypothetical protein